MTVRLSQQWTSVLVCALACALSNGVAAQPASDPAPGQTAPSATAPSAAASSADLADAAASAPAFDNPVPSPTDVPPNSAVASAPTTAAAASSSKSNTCVEHIPEGKARPNIVERFPSSGKSGHQATLEIEIEHGRGERVLPGALQVQTQSDAVGELERRGFYFPDAKGPAKPRVERTETETSTSTRVSLSVVLLPSELGRQVLTLPPLPIAMARASGEVITVCTSEHAITVDDPTANTPNAEPKPNPAPSRQTEFWEALRNAVYGGGIALVIAALVFLLVRWLQRRPKVLPPPPPPRPPWEIAYESFREIRAAQLLERGLYAEHFDRVSHALRLYLGGRFHFDGLESTTSEIIDHLERTPEAHVVLAEVRAFLQENDLVKFAHVEPTAHQCNEQLERSERVVNATVPVTRRPIAEPNQTPPNAGQAASSHAPPHTGDASKPDDTSTPPREEP